MLGYYGEKKELAALVPDTPVSYRLITGTNPDGVPVTAETAAQLSVDAFLCYPGLPAHKLSKKDFFRFLLRHSWKPDWQSILLASFVAGLIPLITPVITETIFQDIIPILDRKGLATVTQVAMVAGFTTVALTTVRSVALLRLSAAADSKVKPALVSRLLSLPVKFFRSFQSGELASRMMGLETMIQLISEETMGVIFSFIFSFWSLALMCYYSVKLTVVAVVIWLLYIVIVGFFLHRLVRAQREMTKAKNTTQGILQQIFTGLVKFRVRGAEEQAYHLWGEKFADEWKWNYAARWLKNYNTIITAVQPVLLSLLLYYFGIREVADAATNAAAQTNPINEALGGGSALTVATFIAFQAAYSAFNTSMNAVIPVIEQLSIVQPLLENLQPVLETERCQVLWRFATSVLPTSRDFRKY